MAQSHVKSITVADWTTNVTVFDSQASTATVHATNLVRPSDWNSAHNEYWTLTGNTTGNSTASGTNVVFAASGGALLGGSTGSVIFSLPVLSAFEPNPLTSGSANSSHAPASWWFNKISLPAPVTVSNVFFINSVTVSASSNASVTLSYSKGLTIFKRQDFGANSTNLTTVTTASFGLTGIFQGGAGNSMTIRWVTDTTGGTKTISTNGASNAFSSFFSGNKLFGMPMVTSLSEGEYFFAHKHSTTTSTVGANLSLLSMSQFYIAPQNITMGQLGSAGSRAMSHVWNDGEGVASAVTTTSTMPITVVSQATRHWIYFHLANHATL